MTETAFERQPPFFVVGSDRSGTTMLMMMLDAHPGLGMSRESWFLIDLMNALPLHGALSLEQVHQAFEIIGTHPRWQIADSELRACLDGLDQPELAELVTAVFQLDLERGGKTRWGDKTPAYVREIARIHSLFPRAQFIHLIRDVRDVCISLRNVGWHGPTLGHMARYWRAHVSSGIAAGRALGAELYLEVPYETLVTDVEATLRRICAFLGEPFSPAMLTWYEHTAAKTASRPMKFQTKLDRAPRASDVGRWRAEMSALDLAIVEANAGETMDRAGQVRRYPKSLSWFGPLLSAVEGIGLVFARIRRRLGIGDSPSSD
ncbi:MAG: sulfotransferase [Pseudomonadota bacterium]|nr:MAG: sulfotransferase [Pseudomonadota bacterium]